MSQETSIPEPNDAESPALSAEGTTLSDSGDIAKSATSVNEALSLSEEDVWESVKGDNEAQPIASAEVLIEKAAELAAESLPPKRPSRVTSGAAVTANQPTSWQRFQRYWQAEIQPALKEQTIKTLKATIRAIESLINRLEAQPAASSPQQSPTPWRQIRRIWGSVLGLTRSLLPRSLRRSSDGVLSGAIAGVLLLTIWTTSSIFSKAPTQVATAPENQSAPAKSTDSKETSVPNDQPVAKPTPDIISTEPRPTQTLLTPPEKTPETIPELIPKETTDVAPAPSPAVTPTPKPIPPPLKLTPEQTLIAQIQDQVADVSNQYVNGLIQSVQANFRSSLLTVKVGDDWYTLEQAQQNKLANEMLTRAQKLNFVKLELTDLEGSLLSRSPVIGSEMVILKRTTALQQTT